MAFQLKAKQGEGGLFFNNAGAEVAFQEYLTLVVMLKEALPPEPLILHSYPQGEHGGWRTVERGKGECLTYQAPEVCILACDDAEMGMGERKGKILIFICI